MEWGRPAWDAWLDYDRGLGHAGRADGGGPNPASSNPPLYYLYASLGYRAASGGDLFARMLASRLVSALLLIVTSWPPWLLAGEVLRGDRLLQLAATGLVALAPMVTFLSAAMTPDAMLFAAWTTRVLARRADTAARSSTRRVRRGAARRGRRRDRRQGRQLRAAARRRCSSSPSACTGGARCRCRASPASRAQPPAALVGHGRRVVRYRARLLDVRRRRRSQARRARRGRTCASCSRTSGSTTCRASRARTTSRRSRTRCPPTTSGSRACGRVRLDRGRLPHAASTGSSLLRSRWSWSPPPHRAVARPADRRQGDRSVPRARRPVAAGRAALERVPPDQGRRRQLQPGPLPAPARRRRRDRARRRGPAARAAPAAARRRGRARWAARCCRCSRSSLIIQRFYA